jgi:predicted DNA binding CopG/RHH family protein
MADKERVVVYLDKDIAEILKKKAEEKGLSVSAYVRMLILEYVKKE